MIIVKLTGGLGNQLFQYAFARHLSIKHKVEIKFDVRELNIESVQDKKVTRDFGLIHFNIKSSTASELELIPYQISKFVKFIHLFCLSIGLKLKKNYVRELHFNFYKKALNAPENCYLDGYWQSEKYFEDCRTELLHDFSFVSELSSETKKIAEEIKAQNAVSIHVRRGDYISVPENQSLYVSCDEQYYMSAMKKMVENQKELDFYVFSDEPEWFKANIKTDNKIHFVTHNSGKNSFQDLYLMSLCKHNIIANSSFSWWGAWLNRNVNKIVIAPKKWFKNDSKNTSDLIPKSWIQI